MLAVQGSQMGAELCPASLAETRRRAKLAEMHGFPQTALRAAAGRGLRRDRSRHPRRGGAGYDPRRAGQRSPRRWSSRRRSGHTEAGSLPGSAATASPRRRGCVFARRKGALGRRAREVCPGAVGGRRIVPLPASGRRKRRSDGWNAYLRRVDGETVRITHPCHPLFGQEVAVLHFRLGSESPSVVVELADGTVRCLPLSWTDRALPDAAVAEQGEGRRLSGLGLLEVAELVERWKSEG